MSGPRADAIPSQMTPLNMKRKAQEVSANSSGGTMIRDEDAGWGEIAQDDNGDLIEAVVANDRGFKKRKVVNISTESSWMKVWSRDLIVPFPL